MLLTGIIIPIFTLVIIFLFGVQKFSKQISQATGDNFKRVLEKITNTPLRGVAVGTIFTSILQSSTATSVILVGLVNAGLITFARSIGVILGANIGSTITSQLVAFEVMHLAPYFVLLGFFVTYFGGAYKKWGKPIFYFGLTFFSLTLISLYIQPVQHDPRMIYFFSSISSIYVAIAVGAIFTVFVQSSGVVSGLVVLLVGAGLLGLEQAVGIIMGANIGTTATALVASIHLNVNAKKVAMAHFLFNFLGVFIFLPFIMPFTNLVARLGGSTEQVVANVHVLFNIATVILFLVLVKPFEKLIEMLVVNGTTAKPI